MNLSTFLLILALICALVLAALGFDVFNTDGDPYLAGWLGLALVFYFARDIER